MKYPAGIFPHDPIQVQLWLAVLRRSVITGAVSCEGKPKAGHDVGRCSNISWSGSVCQVVGASNLMRGTPRWKEQRAVTDYTGSFRKNDKSKTVSIGINFHKYCFFWGVLGSKFAANLPSLHWEHVLGSIVTRWHRPIGGSDGPGFPGQGNLSPHSNPLAIKISRPQLPGLLVLGCGNAGGEEEQAQHLGWAQNDSGELCWEFEPGGGGEVCQAPQAACQGLQARWWRHLWGEPEKDSERPG